MLSKAGVPFSISTDTRSARANRVDIERFPCYVRTARDVILPVRVNHDSNGTRQRYNVLTLNSSYYAAEDVIYTISLLLFVSVPDSFAESVGLALIMPPAKSSKPAAEEGKAETISNLKDKNGHGSSNQQSNGKLRRVASSTGSNLKETPNAISSGPGIVTTELVAPTVSRKALLVLNA
jgi:hypothetical protein